MPKRDQLFNELLQETDYGIFLMIQMDGVPETLQLVIGTAQLDEASGGLRDRNQYVVRALGVADHKISVGIFSRLQILDEHPLLDQYNTTPVAVFFRGKPDNPNELLLDIMQAHASTFGMWRTFPHYLNIQQPLFDLLTSGGGLLGKMPPALAERLDKVLVHHGLETKLMEEKIEAEKTPEAELSERDRFLVKLAQANPSEDDHHDQMKRKVLLIDNSYIIAFDFTVDELGKI